MTGRNAQIVRVGWETLDGTAYGHRDFGDFEPSSGVLAFSTGQTSRTVQIAVIGDVDSEPDETLFVRLSNPSNGVIRRGQAVGTILDDDRPGVVYFGDVAGRGRGRRHARVPLPGAVGGRGIRHHDGGLPDRGRDRDGRGRGLSARERDAHLPARSVQRHDPRHRGRRHPDREQRDLPGSPEPSGRSLLCVRQRGGGHDPGRRPDIARRDPGRDRRGATRGSRR